MKRLLLTITTLLLLAAITFLPTQPFDTWVNTQLQNTLLASIFTIITYALSPWVLIIGSLLLLCILYKKHTRHALLLIMSLAGGWISKELIKQFIQRARPENALIEVSGYSFPSGHATIAAIVFTVIIYAFKDNIPNNALKNLFIAGNILLLLLTGFSRIYLRVHWASDIIAGFVLGIFWVMLALLVQKAWPHISNARPS